jgi:glycosyltransferase involved in cell wall biosynthesis
MAAKTSTEYMLQAMSSLLGQSFTDWELIVGVNGLPEQNETFAFAKKFLAATKRRHLAMNLPDCKNKGAALNVMVENSCGEYIAILDVDDLWHPLKLEKQAQFVQRDPCDAVGTLGDYFGDTQQPIGTPSGTITFNSLLKSNGVLNSSAIIKRCHAKWEEMDEPIEDYDMWLRIAKNGGRIFNIPETLTFIRCHAGQWSHQNANVQGLRDKHGN